MDGYGLYTWKNGNSYDGYWKCSKRNGYGKLILVDEEEVYDGEWKEGMKHGKGKLIEESNDYQYDG